MTTATKTTMRRVLAKGDGLFMVCFQTGDIITMDEYLRRQRRLQKAIAARKKAR